MEIVCDVDANTLSCTRSTAAGDLPLDPSSRLNASCFQLRSATPTVTSPSPE
jgi:hypothetical protein